jgi:hypothetical protein
MPPSSGGGGVAAPERTPNARAVAIVDRVNPSYTQSLERRRLRGVGCIEPNDEIGQQPAVLLLLSLVAISWIVLERFEWSGNWVVITPNLPSFAPRVNSWQASGVWRSMATTTAQGHPCLGLLRQSMSDFIEVIKDWPTAKRHPITGARIWRRFSG